MGAHESGRIGEDPKGIPNNLMPYIQQVAVGRLPELNVYGHDYPTEDGSAVKFKSHLEIPGSLMLVENASLVRLFL